MFDQAPPAREERTEPWKAIKEMQLKTAPAPAGLPAPAELKQERTVQEAGKAMSGLSEKEDVSISFKAGDIDSAKRGIKEVLSKLGGRVVREEPVSDTLVITGELGADKLLLFMDKLETLGTVKETILKPTPDKDLVLIKITVANQ